MPPNILLPDSHEGKTVISQCRMVDDVLDASGGRWFLIDHTIASDDQHLKRAHFT